MLSCLSFRGQLGSVIRESLEVSSTDAVEHLSQVSSVKCLTSCKLQVVSICRVPRSHCSSLFDPKQIAKIVSHSKTLTTALKI